MWITDLINLLANAHSPNLERLTLVKLEEETDSPDYDTLRTLLKCCPTLSELVVQSVLSYDWHKYIAVCHTLTKLSMREFVSVLLATKSCRPGPCSKFVSCASPPNGGTSSTAVSKGPKAKTIKDVFPRRACNGFLRHFFSPRLKSLKAHHDLLLKFYPGPKFP